MTPPLKLTTPKNKTTHFHSPLIASQVLQKTTAPLQDPPCKIQGNLIVSRVSSNWQLWFLIIFSFLNPFMLDRMCTITSYNIRVKYELNICIYLPKTSKMNIKKIHVFVFT